MIWVDEMAYTGLDVGNLIPFDSLRKCYFAMISEIFSPFGQSA
jgi:hypothetical protein